MSWRKQEEKCIDLFDESLNSTKMKTATGERLILLVFAACAHQRAAIAAS
jgi:hypothetical protein